MPIVFNKEEGWKIQNPTPEELIAIQEIGKEMIVRGLAGAYVNDIYKKVLLTDKQFFFNA